ncbi:MAG: BamA/TamA family outer membrane protein, partial [Candidatus Zixiibacteriota bacterium]
DRWSVDGFSRSGDYNTKLEFGMGYSYVQQRVKDRTLYTTDIVEFPKDSVAQVFRFSAKLEKDRFYRTRRINYQFRTEDITISRGVAVAISQRRGPGLNELFYNSLDASVFFDLQKGDFIAKSRFQRIGWFGDGLEFRTLTALSLFGFHNGVNWVTFAGRSSYTHDRRQIDFDPLSVDEDRGVRGYPFNYLTGNHSIVGSLEARFHTGVTALTTRLGFAAFFDFGTAWNSGERMKLGEYIWSAGAGVRVDLAQIGGGRMARLDLTYAEATSSWEVSAGMGQFFELF